MVGPMSRWFRNLLIAELAVIAAVMAIFRIIPTRLYAGAVAGTLFVALGAWIVVSGVRDRRVRRSASFALGAVHLFVISLPMMIVRFLNASSAFADVKIYGLAGPAFHQLSSVVYLLLILATLSDWYRFKRNEVSQAGS